MDRHKIFKIMCLISVAALFCLFVGLPSALSGEYDVQVHKLQRRLNQLGYNPGKVDGLWGNKTQKALKKYQKDNNLEINGKLDTATKQSLKLNLVKIGDGEYFVWSASDKGCSPVSESRFSQCEDICTIVPTPEHLVGFFMFDCGKYGHLLIADSYSNCMKMGSTLEDMSKK